MLVGVACLLAWRRTSLVLPTTAGGRELPYGADAQARGVRRRAYLVRAAQFATLLTVLPLVSGLVFDVGPWADGFGFVWWPTAPPAVAAVLAVGIALCLGTAVIFAVFAVVGEIGCRYYRNRVGP